ncbi:hypothetical protein [Gordonia sp. OPL2]|uniref:hypothetical protein n=1 Tax=Gordonia sp. OPL2 TaxID=2486274 RepID=UPI001655A385|nr:hypothetical protein [Gordonia sp. OPL2]ROZ88998.1 hypothetical protein EEB19_20015 [Gordonia sp. OPL2]
MPEFATGGVMPPNRSASNLFHDSFLELEQDPGCPSSFIPAGHNQRSIAILEKLRRATDEASVTIREIADDA